MSQTSAPFVSLLDQRLEDAASLPRITPRGLAQGPAKLAPTGEQQPLSDLALAAEAFPDPARHRHELGNRSASVRDKDLLAGSDAIQIAAQTRFQLRNPHLHMTTMVR